MSSHPHTSRATSVNSQEGTSQSLLGRVVRHQGVQAVAMTMVGGLGLLGWLMLPRGWQAVTVYGAVWVVILAGLWFSRPTRVR